MELVQPAQQTRTIFKWLKTPWALTVSLLLLQQTIDAPHFLSVIGFAVTALLGTAPYIIVAIFMIAALKSTGAEVMVAEAFKGREARMIVLAALFGGLAPFCSCEVIPFIAALLALGAPISAIMAFWLSAPLIDPPTLLITAAALGWSFAIAKVVAAVGLGLMGGFITSLLMRRGAFASPLRPDRQSAGCCNTPDLDSKPHWRFWQVAERRRQFREEFLSNGIFLLKWLTLAYVVEALMVHYLPAEAVANLVGGESIISISIAALVGMPAYLNSYVAPPMLAGLIEQGMSDGAAMAFMVSGSVSSMPAMMAVFSLVRSQVFASYLGFGFIGAVITGLIFQAVI